MERRIVLVCAILALGLAAAGCGATASSSPPDVVAAFYPLAFAAQEVGAGDVVDLTPAGAEPHDLEITARSIREIRAARLVVYLGDGFQPALEDAVADRSGRSLDLLAGQDLLGPPGGGDGTDPHVWLDPRRYARMARAIARALGPPASADALVRRLDGLDAAFASGLRQCERRELVTSHAAFGYLARRYGLTQVPLTGIAPEVEPSPRDIQRLVGEIRRTGATTVFFEPLVSPKLADTVAREAGVRTASLDPLEGLTAREADAGEDYFSVMRRNLRHLREALGCR